MEKKRPGDNATSFHAGHLSTTTTSKINKKKQGKSTRNCVTRRVFLLRIYIFRYLTSPTSRWDPGLNLRRVIHKQHGSWAPVDAKSQQQPIAFSSMEKSFKLSGVTVDIRTEKQQHHWNDAYTSRIEIRPRQRRDTRKQSENDFDTGSGAERRCCRLDICSSFAPCAFNRSRGTLIKPPVLMSLRV